MKNWKKDVFSQAANFAGMIFSLTMVLDPPDTKKMILSGAWAFMELIIGAPVPPTLMSIVFIETCLGKAKSCHIDVGQISHTLTSIISVSPISNRPYEGGIGTFGDF
jgi:hypothetical protein